MKFLINTSDFTWRKRDVEIEPEELLENRKHLLAKLCAIGYMAMEYKDVSVNRAVIGMDGKQSEVGESNGRSGKSLIGVLMKHILPSAYVNGKRKDLLEDQFVWNDVVENTKLVFIDDVLMNFNFERLFPNLTGDWTVNYKAAAVLHFHTRLLQRYTLPQTMPSGVKVLLSQIVNGCWGSVIFTTTRTNR